MKTVKLKGMYFSKSHLKSDHHGWHENVRNAVTFMFKQRACFWAEAGCMFLSAAGHVSAIPHGLRKGQEAGCGGGDSESQDFSPNSLENVKDAFSTLGHLNLRKHILALGCPRNNYLPICSCEEFSRPPPHRSAYLSHRPLMGQLRGCEVSSNYSEPLPGPLPPTPRANLASTTQPRPNHTRRPPEHTGSDTPKDPVGAQLRHP